MSGKIPKSIFLQSKSEEYSYWLWKSCICFHDFFSFALQETVRTTEKICIRPDLPDLNIGKQTFFNLGWSVLKSLVKTPPPRVDFYCNWNTLIKNIKNLGNFFYIFWNETKKLATNWHFVQVHTSTYQLQ
jgi:hypothetical protein